MHQLDPSRVDYVVHMTSYIPVLEPTHFLQAFTSLVDRHPSLRTTYKEVNGIPLQVVHAPGNLKPDWSQKNASTWSASELHTALHNILHTPFDLKDGPILRLHLFSGVQKTLASRISTIYSEAAVQSAVSAEPEQSASTCEGTAGYVFLLTAPHIALDGWSMDVILRDTMALYEEAVTGAKSCLPKLPLDVSEYAQQQKKHVAGVEGERDWAYWQNELGGNLPVLSMPTDYPRPPIMTSKGAWHRFVVPSSLSLGLKRFIKAEGMTLFMMLFATFQTLLHRYSGQSDILTGSPMACRTSEALGNIVAQIANPVVLRTRFPTGVTFKRILSNVRQTVVSAFMHQDYPLPLLVERLVRYRDPRYAG